MTSSVHPLHETDDTRLGDSRGKSTHRWNWPLTYNVAFSTTLPVLSSRFHRVVHANPSRSSRNLYLAISTWHSDTSSSSGYSRLQTCGLALSARTSAVTPPLLRAPPFTCSKFSAPHFRHHPLHSSERLPPPVRSVCLRGSTDVLIRMLYPLTDIHHRILVYQILALLRLHRAVRADTRHVVVLLEAEEEGGVEFATLLVSTPPRIVLMNGPLAPDPRANSRTGILTGHLVFYRIRVKLRCIEGIQPGRERDAVSFSRTRKRRGTYLIDQRDIHRPLGLLCPVDALPHPYVRVLLFVKDAYIGRL